MNARIIHRTAIMVIAFLALCFSRCVLAQTNFRDTTVTIDYHIAGDVYAVRSILTMIAGGSISGGLTLGDSDSFTMQDGSVGSLTLNAENGANVNIYGGGVGSIAMQPASGNLSIYGGAIGIVDQRGRVLKISGGIISSLQTNGGFTMTGGHITGNVQNNNVSAVGNGIIANGIIDGMISSYGTFSISGGLLNSIDNHSRITVSGGRMSSIVNNNDLHMSVMTISGGTLSGVLSNRNARATITGGNLSGTFYNDMNGVLDVYGRGLVLSADGHLTGQLRDGGTINLVSANPADNGLITLHNPPTSSVSGTINFRELVAQAQSQNVTFTFQPSDGSMPTAQTLSVLPIGTFTVPNLPRQAGVLHIKPDKFLAVNVSVDLSGGNVSGANVTVEPGDANNDNSVDSTDFGILIGAYGSSASAPGSGYDPAADFNGDGFVDSADFGLLIGNYNAQGEM